MAQPHTREAGTGPAVVCLHSNASHGGQWRALMARLAPSHRVLAPDSYGSGSSPEWSSDRTISLADEVAFLAPVLASAGEPFGMVGHSYGAAVALRAALQQPQRVRALVLYEPTMFSLIEADGPAPNEADGIRNTVAAAAAALDAGDKNLAAKCFIDYWMGPGSWDATPPERQPAIANSTVNVRRWGHALMTEPTPLAAFASLDVPVLLMTGGRSPASAQGVARRLLGVLPRVEHQVFEKLGHMGPITHPEPVNEAIEAFLQRHA
ncbi:alpha/beta fold hydrolase [Hydrogenophaga sp. PBL-H3]|uniref:alpha/beta fold hydrolase n=1 Tax=Hydrogenophaga sp. PBL-H3 TaxID=434010 RepID=UPI00131FA793|nr:alpha/beta hydrolase [Hydrogenophaga sp. PBL-H3]QHE75603.1 alpha/beta hydrolase [Hydrogenophaga sp. PBL-H3]QHE80029.1 alpha/beta hydrolase [Hydrogenophaga sp. PBL-H3]